MYNIIKWSNAYSYFVLNDRVELTVSEIGQQSQMLQEDNGQLQGRVMQMKDDLQKMTLHYEECRKELQDKVNELENLQLNRLKGEERCKNLIDTIRHLEEIIQIKEEELETKDKEIQKIAQDLMEQQLLSDRVITNEVRTSNFDCFGIHRIQFREKSTPFHDLKNFSV